MALDPRLPPAQRGVAGAPQHENDISASYRDGILEIRIPLPEEPEPEEPKKISIQKG